MTKPVKVSLQAEALATERLGAREGFLASMSPLVPVMSLLLISDVVADLALIDYLGLDHGLDFGRVFQRWYLLILGCMVNIIMAKDFLPFGIVTLFIVIVLTQSRVNDNRIIIVVTVVLLIMSKRYAKIRTEW